MAYGDLRVLRKYCFFPGWKPSGQLQHGWSPVFYNDLAEMIVGSNGLSRYDKDRAIYVAREDQKEALVRDGYTNVSAIGLPIVYLQPRASARELGSLLIMPDHSLPERDTESEDQNYFDYLSNFSQYFSSITLCLHKACYDKKRWIKLSQLADRVVIGADPGDKKSYGRLAELMSTHEFMTTNDFGSHVPYAAYFGCKVSVGGPRPKFDVDDLPKSAFYRNCPDCLEMRSSVYHEKKFFKSFSFFMTDPQAAEKMEEWARWEIGVQCKKSPAELRAIFGWSYSRLPIMVAKYCVRTARRYSEYIFTTLNLLRYYGISGLKVRYALESAKISAAHYTELPSKPHSLKIRNRSSDIDVVVQHFGRRELLDIDYPKKVRTILDLGANIGVSALALRSIFPDAEIIAVEMNTENFNLLKENCSHDPLIKLENAAIWSEDGAVCQVDVGDGEWALRVGDHPGKNLGEVPSFTFATILRKNKIDRIDVCKMDIEGAEVDVLMASWREIFSKTKVLILEIHHWIPNCAESVNGVIEEAKKAFNLDITHSGEFTVIRNTDL